MPLSTIAHCAQPDPRATEPGTQRPQRPSAPAAPGLEHLARRTTAPVGSIGFSAPSHPRRPWQLTRSLAGVRVPGTVRGAPLTEVAVGLISGDSQKTARSWVRVIARLGARYRAAQFDGSAAPPRQSTRCFRTWSRPRGSPMPPMEVSAEHHGPVCLEHLCKQSYGVMYE